jgi:hypothetical protein
MWNQWAGSTPAMGVVRGQSSTKGGFGQLFCWASFKFQAGTPSEVSQSITAGGGQQQCA